MIEATLDRILTALHHQGIVLDAIASVVLGGPGMTHDEITQLTTRLRLHSKRIADILQPSQQEVFMAVPQNLTDILAKIDADTTALAGVVSSLRDQIKTSMTQADVDSVQQKLTDVATRLEATAKDPNAPVPVTPMPTP
jgi:actin-like ATPase involved in cell morphogenesis